MQEEWSSIGLHRVRRQDDVLILELRGEYRLEDCKVIYPMLAAMWAEDPNAFAIVDSTGMIGLMSPEVRRFVGEFGRRHFQAEYRSVLIVRNVVVRALASMVIALSRIGRAAQGDTVFVATVEEAWGYVARVRLERVTKG